MSFQIIVGLLLSCFYIPSAKLAESSINYIMNEINEGYLLQRTHVILASMIFILIYLHMFKGIYYKMYRWSNRSTWWTGNILLYLLIVEAFTGYILPWGQMSFWGATVITNLFSIIPVFGPYLISFIWGGSIVNGLTLERFFMFHYLIPSLIVAFMLLHLGSLHRLGSSNTKTYSINLDINFIQLYPYYIIKDIAILIFVLGVTFYLISFKPFIFDNLVNNLLADSKVTPKHIVPEWYFLSFYIILKLILIKWLGILIMFFFIIFPVFLPLLSQSGKPFLHFSTLLLQYWKSGILKINFFVKKCLTIFKNS